MNYNNLNQWLICYICFLYETKTLHICMKQHLKRTLFSRLYDYTAVLVLPSHFLESLSVFEDYFFNFLIVELTAFQQI